MKKIITVILLAFAFSSAYSQNPQSFIDLKGAAPSDFIASRLTRIDSAYQRLVDNKIIPCAVVFVARKGRIIKYKAYGWRDVEKQIPCKKDDIFRIASQTKAITVVALMTLFEEGRFLMDEPIKKYIPEFENPRVLDNNFNGVKYASHPAKRDITIRDLITHTSGIEGYGGKASDIYYKHHIYPYVRTDSVLLGEVVRRIAKLPLAHEPGEKFTYGMSVDVLGYLIEVLSGEPVDQFIKERVLDPLGMKDTYFYLPEDKADRLVTLYEYPQGDTLQRSQNELYQSFPVEGERTYFGTGAGMCGAIRDYAKFCQMLLNDGEFNGKRILGRKTLEMMRQNGVGDLRGEIGFGMAWDVFRPEYAHQSIASIGSSRWGGMFGTDYLIDPKEDMILLVYTNILPNYSGTDPKALLHNVTYQALK